jgi:tRNA pseudouridine synthase B (EC 4.2.1.70)
MNTKKIEKFLAQELKDGIVLLVDKPLGWTSFDVVNKLRYKINKIVGGKIKVGHAGTLDPLATGLLIVATGKKTKELQSWQDQDKEYEGTLKLGATTPSYDAETAEDRLFTTEVLNHAILKAAAQGFEGEVQQYPPMFSAVKVGGKPLYKLARKGESIAVEARTVRIDEFSLSAFRLPLVDFKVRCSKGTYIRSLVRDFGERVQSGAYLTALRRVRSGVFCVDDAWLLDDLVQVLEKSIPS